MTSLAREARIAKAEVPAIPLDDMFDADHRITNLACKSEAASTTIAQVTPIDRPLTADEIWLLPIPALLGRASLDLEEMKVSDIPRGMRATFAAMLILPIDGEPFIATREGLDAGSYDLAVRGLIQRHVTDPVTHGRPVHLATIKGGR